MEQLKIRRLTHKDMVRLTGMIQRSAGDLAGTKLDGILGKVTGEGSSEKEPEGVDSSGQIVALGVQVISALLEVLQGEMIEWYGDLLGVKVEEIDDMPFGTVPLVTAEIVESEEFASFFSGLSRVRKAVGAYRGEFARGAAG